MLLEPSSFQGSELEEQLRESGVQLYTTAGLLEVVQASEQELVAGLEQLGACCIQGIICAAYIYCLVFQVEQQCMTKPICTVGAN